MRTSKRIVEVFCDSCNKSIADQEFFWNIGKDTEQTIKFDSENYYNNEGEWKHYHFCNLQCAKDWIAVKGTDYESIRPV